MDLRDAISELETFVWNSGNLWQVTAWLRRNRNITELSELTNLYDIFLVHFFVDAILENVKD